jgi:hypothetical protein
MDGWMEEADNIPAWNDSEENGCTVAEWKKNGDPTRMGDFMNKYW